MARLIYSVFLVLSLYLSVHITLFFLLNPSALSHLDYNNFRRVLYLLFALLTLVMAVKGLVTSSVRRIQPAGGNTASSWRAVVESVKAHWISATCVIAGAISLPIVFPLALPYQVQNSRIGYWVSVVIGEAIMVLVMIAAALRLKSKLGRPRQ